MCLHTPFWPIPTQMSLDLWAKKETVKYLKTYPSFACPRAKSLQPYLTLCNPMDCSPPGSSLHGILQARILEWVAMPSSRGSSRPRDQASVSYISHTTSGFYCWAMEKAHPSFKSHHTCVSKEGFPGGPMSLSKLWVGDGQGSLACCSPQSRRVGHDWETELIAMQRTWLWFLVQEDPTCEEQLSLCTNCRSLCAVQLVLHNKRIPCSEKPTCTPQPESSPHLLQLEKVHMQQRRSSTAQNKNKQIIF